MSLISPDAHKNTNRVPSTSVRFLRLFLLVGGVGSAALICILGSVPAFFFVDGLLPSQAFVVRSQRLPATTPIMVVMKRDNFIRENKRIATFL